MQDSLVIRIHRAFADCFLTARKLFTWVLQNPPRFGSSVDSNISECSPFYQNNLSALQRTSLLSLGRPSRPQVCEPFSFDSTLTQDADPERQDITIGEPLRPLTSLKWPYVPEESAYPDPLKRDDPKIVQLSQYEAIGNSPFLVHVATDASYTLYQLLLPPCGKHFLITQT